MQTTNTYSCSPTERLQCAKFPAFCNVGGRYQCRTERGRNENIYKPEEWFHWSGGPQKNALANWNSPLLFVQLCQKRATLK